MMRLFLVITLLISLAGCATTAYTPREPAKPAAPTSGFYHEVTKGETLWYIARNYNVELKDVIAANRLPNASKIEVGQLIFIPRPRAKIEKDAPFQLRKGEDFAWPARGTVVSYFGSTKDMVQNTGIDIRTQEWADVVASRSGKVTFVSDHMQGYGRTIILDHLDGFQTVYAHNAKNLVGVDQRVKQGEVIAKAGKSGRVTNPTLHFEIRKEHKPQNPFYYLP